MKFKSFPRAFTTIWVIVVAVICLFLFIFKYHYPVKLNDENKNIILTELSKDSTLNVVENSIKFGNTVGIATITNLIEGKRVKEEKEYQEFTFKSVNNNDTTNMIGLMFLKPKTLSYNIDSIIVIK